MISPELRFVNCKSRNVEKLRLMKLSLRKCSSRVVDNGTGFLGLNVVRYSVLKARKKNNVKFAEKRKELEGR